MARRRGADQGWMEPDPTEEGDTMTMLFGDVREVLTTLPDQSVQCVVTSPPYWNLRDYGMLGQIGLEPTIAEYVDTIVGVFREVWRVLRDDGTLWLNMGDSYSGSGKGAWANKNGGQKEVYIPDPDSPHVRNPKVPDGLKPKDLCGIPWRVAFALQDDGWYLRRDIIWHKPNPMPESAKDRPTTAHEYLFLLTKKPRYYYDAKAIEEPAASLPTKMPDGWDTGEGAHGSFHRNGREKGKQHTGHRFGGNKYGDLDDPRTRTKIGNVFNGSTTRNKRSVWTIPTQPFPAAHFATFPEKLVEPCILAGTSEKGECPECGKPWMRATTTTYTNPGNRTTNGPRSTERRHETAGFAVRLEKQTETTGWQPTCTCDFEPVPQTVLDPFIGSGTVAVVSERHGRKWIGIDLGYEDVSTARIEDARIPKKQKNARKKKEDVVVPNIQLELPT